MTKAMHEEKPGEPSKATAETSSETSEWPMLAAVDLGSNSFRMVIARVVDDSLLLVDRLREGVRLAGYLDDQKRISWRGQQRALECLHKFGQRLREFPPGTVRAVGTNTLRKARNTDEFLKEARKALGHPIEVVSGHEEARMIFLGVAQSLAGGPSKRLVVDIGGGSTECIIGEAFEPQLMQSLYMGCVSYTLKYFPDGRLSKKRMSAAETAARLELRSLERTFRHHGWERAVGASGTVHAVAEILRQQGWSDVGISAEGLTRLRQTLIDHRHVDELELIGMRRDRARVLPGGVAILSAIFERLRVDRMYVSPGAMREGVLYDLLGRLRHEDARDHTIERLMDRYHVDREQAGRIEAVALDCLEQVHERWKIDLEIGRSFLRWATQLHEIGLAISHSGFHKHGAYIIEHSTLPGFSYQNQRILALLVQGQRRRFRRFLFRDALPRAEARLGERLCRMLRLACVLNRSRSSRQLPELRYKVKGKRMRVEFPEGWLQERPLTHADLGAEAAYMESAGLELDLRSKKPAADEQEIA